MDPFEHKVSIIFVFKYFLLEAKQSCLIISRTKMTYKWLNTTLHMKIKLMWLPHVVDLLLGKKILHGNIFVNLPCIHIDKF